MKEQEDRWSKRFYRRSPQLQFRSGLVSWLIGTSKELGLHPSTIHLAIKILDSFMDGHNIEQEKLTLVAIAALTIAAKFAEKETKVLGQAFFHGFFILPANGFPGFLS